MATFYIDFTQGSLGNKKVKYHGGGDFSRFIVNRLGEKLDLSSFQSIAILWPKGVQLSNLSEAEKDIYDRFQAIEIADYSDVAYKKDDVLFFPLLDSLSVKIVGQIKKMNPDLKLYGVLHGLRLIDVSRYDKYDKYYYSGIKANTIYLWARRWMAATMARFYLRRNLPMADRIYTVSNNSMQKINPYCKGTYIKYFTRDLTPVKGRNLTVDDTRFEDKFILFVNSNRYEKNFIRSLIAFCRFKEKNENSLKLYVLGSSEIVRNNILKIKEVNKSIVDADVRFVGYVDAATLYSYYKNCEFLLYTSKSEGYGLPPMEAMNAGRPTVASSHTSVPEVLGMCAYYVDPYSIESIERGINYMSKKENQDNYIKKFNEMSHIILDRGRRDIDLLTEELLG